MFGKGKKGKGKKKDKPVEKVEPQEVEQTEDEKETLIAGHGAIHALETVIEGFIHGKKIGHKIWEVDQVIEALKCSIIRVAEVHGITLVGKDGKEIKDD